MDEAQAAATPSRRRGPLDVIIVTIGLVLAGISTYVVDTLRDHSPC